MLNAHRTGACEGTRWDVRAHPGGPRGGRPRRRGCVGFRSRSLGRLCSLPSSVCATVRGLLVSSGASRAFSSSGLNRDISDMSACGEWLLARRILGDDCLPSSRASGRVQHPTRAKRRGRWRHKLTTRIGWSSVGPWLLRRRHNSARKRFREPERQGANCSVVLLTLQSVPSTAAARADECS